MSVSRLANRHAAQTIRSILHECPWNLMHETTRKYKIACRYARGRAEIYFPPCDLCERSLAKLLGTMYERIRTRSFDVCVYPFIWFLYIFPFARVYRCILDILQLRGFKVPIPPGFGTVLRFIFRKKLDTESRKIARIG